MSLTGQMPFLRPPSFEVKDGDEGKMTKFVDDPDNPGKKQGKSRRPSEF